MDPMPSLRTVRPEVGLGLARVVRRALAKVPADRFPTAGALAQALADPEAFAASAGASAEWTSESVSATGAGTRRGWHARPVRAGVAALGLAALVVGLALALHARRPPPLAVDPARIAVAPFRVSAADPALGYLREGMVDLLATKLGGTQAVHPVDSRTLLAAWREGRRGAREPSGAEALTVAGRLGAGRLVEGELVASGRRLTLSATLRAVPDGRAVLRVSVEGSADSLTPLVEQVAARLLARAAEEPEERLPALAATSPAALRAYLDGEVLLRQHVIPTASVRKFDEALAADSSLVLAALGVVRAAARIGGDFGHPRVHAQVETAWRFRDRLSRDDRAFLEVLLGPRYPEPVTWRALLEQAGAYAQLAPDRADAWHFYGGILLQVGILTGIPDASRQAETALGRALALDSSDAASAAEFARLAAALGDTAAARRGIRLLRQSDSSSPGSVAECSCSAARPFQTSSRSPSRGTSGNSRTTIRPAPSESGRTTGSVPAWPTLEPDQGREDHIGRGSRVVLQAGRSALAFGQFVSAGPGQILAVVRAHRPGRGGNTEFADMRAAYDALDDRTKAEVAELVCEHSLLYSRQAVGFTDFTPEEISNFRPVRHPLVRVQKATGRKSLFLSAHAGVIVGWSVPESRAFLRDLTEHATRPEFVYSHSWRQHDLVVWDNRTTMHRARRFDRSECATCAARPWGRGADRRR